MELVFSGYGIVAPEYDYSDYQIINAEGKIVDFLMENLFEGEDYCEDIQIKPTTESIVKFVSENIYSIGYGGIGYLTDSVKTLKIDGVSPTAESIIEDVYPISRYLHVYTLKQPEGEIKKFIDWVISD